MRIGIDGSCWANRRGFGRFTRCLVHEIAARGGDNEYVLLLDSASADDPSLAPPPSSVAVEVAEVRAAPASAAAAGGRRVGDVWRMGAAARRLGCDVFYFPASYSYFPVLRTPVVVTIHDAIAERHPALTLPSRRDRFQWRLKQRAALLEARAVITVSEASKAAIAAALRVRPDRQHVIREAPDPHFRPLDAAATEPVLARFGVGAGTPFVLYVGGISPHKNLEVLVAAFDRVGAVDPRVRLLVVGDADDDPFLSAAHAVRAAVERSPVRDRIQLTGYVSDDDLVALYSGAVATVLPSLGEGFGLTAAESAACHTPVVASRDPALEELLGDAGLYADAADPAGFAERLLRLLTDDAARAAAKDAIAVRAAGWSWRQAADTTVHVLEDVARHRG